MDNEEGMSKCREGVEQVSAANKSKLLYRLPITYIYTCSLCPSLLLPPFTTLLLDSFRQEPISWNLQLPKESMRSLIFHRKLTLSRPACSQFHHLAQLSPLRLYKKRSAKAKNARYTREKSHGPNAMPACCKNPP
jgi:hypothetical protein